MAQLLKFHLFNCDNVYQLGIVEDLLKATKAKLGFEFSVEKHIFALSEMSELSTTTIPAMKMDFAMFVVHAHESVLLINNDNLEQGYAKVYRALLQATGENVIVVIGGDDNYKNETEEEQSIISRWAKRKIAYSQFSEEFMDGRKSFVFSWNKKHRAIHEEALLHYFDPSKKGQKFEYQPPQAPSSQTPQSASSTELEKEAVEEDSAQQLSSLVSRIEIDRKLSHRAGARPKKFNISRSPKDLVILGCNVPEDSMHSATRVFEEITPKLNLVEHPSVLNLPVDEVKNYLTRNHLKFKFCLLVLDAVAVKHAYESHSQQEYEELLATAADAVVSKVIVLVCENRLSSPKDEVIDRIISIVDRIITREKGFIAKLENGKLSVDPDVLVHCSERNPQTDPLEGLKNSSTHLDPPQGNEMRNPSEWQPKYGCNETRKQEEQGVTTIPYASATSFTGHITPNREPVMLKSQLRHGKISCLPEDLEILFPGFQVPDGITQRLLHEYGDTIQAGVKVVRDSNGKLRVTVEPKSKDSSREEVVQIADNETLLLATCIRYGKVSFEKGDLRYVSPNWKIPAYITTSLAREYGTLPKGELYVISDEKGAVKFKVEFGTVGKVLDRATKAWWKVKNFKS